MNCSKLDTAKDAMMTAISLSIDNGTLNLTKNVYGYRAAWIDEQKSVKCDFIC
jgi:hypothetical protein